MAAIVVNADDQQLHPVGTSRQDVGGECGCSFDRHGLLTTKFEQGHFGSQGSGEGLCMTDESSGGQRQVITDFEQLLYALVGNEMAHSGAVVSTHHDASFECDTNGACPGLHDVLLF